MKKQRRHNSGLAKVAVQWLLNICASSQVQWWQTVLCFVIATFAKPQTVMTKFKIDSK
jgi:hypothetical protein